MLLPVPATTVDLGLAHLLARFSDATVWMTASIFVACALLATRCKGCCREDEIFRPHVI